jgi:hypothetical protein
MHRCGLWSGLGFWSVMVGGTTRCAAKLVCDHPRWRPSLATWTCTRAFRHILRSSCCRRLQGNESTNCYVRVCVCHLTGQFSQDDQLLARLGLTPDWVCVLIGVAEMMRGHSVQPLAVVCTLSFWCYYLFFYTYIQRCFRLLFDRRAFDEYWSGSLLTNIRILIDRVNIWIYIDQVDDRCDDELNRWVFGRRRIIVEVGSNYKKALHKNIFIATHLPAGASWWVKIILLLIAASVI